MARTPITIAIVAAMSEELAPFHQIYPGKLLRKQGKCCITESQWFYEAMTGSLVLIETGIGKANAAFATGLLCEGARPDVIINTGSAGGLNPKCAVGDVVFAQQLLYSDVDATGFSYDFGQVPQMPAVYPFPSDWQKKITRYFDTPQSTATYKRHQGMILTADSFMSSPAFVEQVKTRFPEALASDMESTAIAQIAKFYRVPVVNIRGISDLAGAEAPQVFEQQLATAARHAFIEVQQFLKFLLKEAIIP